MVVANVLLWFQQLYVASGDNTETGDEESQTENRDDSEANRSTHVADTTDDSNSIGAASAAETSQTSEDNTSTSSVPPEENEESETTNTCIICHCDKVTVALLPCRHTCVCRYCLMRLEKCPMCREPIQSYFLLNGANNGSMGYQPRPASVDDNPSNSPQWWVNFNQRVNNFLGFS